MSATIVTRTEQLSAKINEIRVAQMEGTKNLLMIGKILKDIRDEKLWKGEFDSFDANGKGSLCHFLGYKKSTAHAAISAYMKFAVLFGTEYETPLFNADYSKLVLLAPMVKSEEDAKRYAIMASELTVEDLRRNIAEEKTGIPSENCPHDNYYILRLCRTCRWKEVLESSDDEEKEISRLLDQRKMDEGSR